MDRALDLRLLQEALDGQQPTLPSPDELQDLLAEAETRLFLRQTVIPDDLLRVGWFLHAVASVNRAQDIYDLPRQRRALPSARTSSTLLWPTGPVLAVSACSWPSGLRWATAVGT